MAGVTAHRTAIKVIVSAPALLTGIIVLLSTWSKHCLSPPETSVISITRCCALSRNYLVFTSGSRLEFPKESGFLRSHPRAFG
jgi:hypothetical protein